MYPVAHLDVSEMRKYPPLEPLIRRLDEPGIIDRLTELIISFFEMIRGHVDYHTRDKKLCYTKLAITIPTQWELYGAVQVAYEAIIRKVWSEEEFEVTFVSEVEGVTHALHASEQLPLQDHARFTVLDFGGHTIVSTPDQHRKLVRT